MSKKTTGPSGAHLGAAGDNRGQRLVYPHYNPTLNTTASDRPSWPHEKAAR